MCVRVCAVHVLLVHVMCLLDQSSSFCTGCIEQFSSTYFIDYFGEKGYSIANYSLFQRRLLKCVQIYSICVVCALVLIRYLAMACDIYPPREQSIEIYTEQMFNGNDLSRSNCTQINKLPTKHTFGVQCQFN